MAECACKRLPGAGLVLVVSVALASTAAAATLLDQFIAPDVPGTDVQRGVTVLSRERPDYNPLGVRLGDFMILPQLAETAGFDDNVTATRHSQGSAIAQTTASLSAVYDYSDMTAVALFSANDTEYLQQPGQSSTTWTASLGGSYDLGSDTISASYSHQNLAQTVQGLNVQQLDQALPYRIDQANLGYRLPSGPLFVVPALTVANFSYDNGSAAGSVLQQSFRDRIVINPTMTVGYAVGPATLVGVLRDAEASYTAIPIGTPTRDFNDVSLLAGIDYEATGFLRYRLLVGYETRTFTSAAYKTISAPIVEGSVIWNVTGLTTITAEAARRIQDSAAEATVGLTESAVALRVDHELYRNILLRASAGYTDDEYSQNRGRQSLITAGIGATYLLNRNMQISASYDFSARHSPSPVSGLTGTTSSQQLGESYNDNRFVVQISSRI